MRSLARTSLSRSALEDCGCLVTVHALNFIPHIRRMSSPEFQFDVPVPEGRVSKIPTMMTMNVLASLCFPQVFLPLFVIRSFASGFNHRTLLHVLPRWQSESATDTPRETYSISIDKPLTKCRTRRRSLLASLPSNSKSNRNPRLHHS